MQPCATPSYAFVVCTGIALLVLLNFERISFEQCGECLHSPGCYKPPHESLVSTRIVASLCLAVFGLPVTCTVVLG